MRLRGEALHHPLHGGDGVAQIELVGAQLHLAGLDLRQIEDVVNQLEQMIAGGVNVLEEFVQPRRNRLARVLEQHARKSDDRIERRAQLVRHVREKLILRTISRHQPQVRFAQLVRSLHHALFERVGESFEIFVEQRVLDRDRGLVRDRSQKNRIVLTERVLVVTLDGDDADDTIARDHRHAEP